MPVMLHAFNILTMSIADSDRLHSRYTLSIKIIQALSLVPDSPQKAPQFPQFPRLHTFSSEATPVAPHPLPLSAFVTYLRTVQVLFDVQRRCQDLFQDSLTFSHRVIISSVKLFGVGRLS